MALKLVWDRADLQYRIPTTCGTYTPSAPTTFRTSSPSAGFTSSRLAMEGLCSATHPDSSTSLSAIGRFRVYTATRQGDRCPSPCRTIWGDFYSTMPSSRTRLAVDEPVETE